MDLIDNEPLSRRAINVMFYSSDLADDIDNIPDLKRRIITLGIRGLLDLRNCGIGTANEVLAWAQGAPLPPRPPVKKNPPGTYAESDADVMLNILDDGRWHWIWEFYDRVPDKARLSATRGRMMRNGWVEGEQINISLPGMPENFRYRLRLIVPNESIPRRHYTK